MLNILVAHMDVNSGHCCHTLSQSSQQLDDDEFHLKCLNFFYRILLFYVKIEYDSWYNRCWKLNFICSLLSLLLSFSVLLAERRAGWHPHRAEQGAKCQGEESRCHRPSWTGFSHQIVLQCTVWKSLSRQRWSPRSVVIAACRGPSRSSRTARRTCWKLKTRSTRRSGCSASTWPWLRPERGRTERPPPTCESNTVRNTCHEHVHRKKPSTASSITLYLQLLVYVFNLVKNNQKNLWCSIL